MQIACNEFHDTVCNKNNKIVHNTEIKYLCFKNIVVSEAIDKDYLTLNGDPLLEIITGLKVARKYEVCNTKSKRNVLHRISFENTFTKSIVIIRRIMIENNNDSCQKKQIHTVEINENQISKTIGMRH